MKCEKKIVYKGTLFDDEVEDEYDSQKENGKMMIYGWDDDDLRFKHNDNNLTLNSVHA